MEFGDVADTVIETAALLGVDLIAFGLKAPDTYVDRLPGMHAYEIVCTACPALSLRASRFVSDGVKRRTQKSRPT